MFGTGRREYGARTAAWCGGPPAVLVAQRRARAAQRRRCHALRRDDHQRDRQREGMQSDPTGLLTTYTPTYTTDTYTGRHTI